MNELIKKYGDDYFTSLKADYISSSEASVIPIPTDDSGTVSYCTIPSSNSMFSASLKIQETADTLMVEPFDWLEELNDSTKNNNLDLSDIISVETELTENQTFGTNFKYNFTSEDKAILKKLLSKSNYNPDEVLSFVVEMLETHSTKLVETKNGLSREKLTETDLLTLLQTLNIRTHFDEIVELLFTMDNTDFDAMTVFIHKKNKLLDFFEKLK